MPTTKDTRYLVFDWGGTELKYAIMDANCTILEQGAEPTPDHHTKTKDDFLLVVDTIVEARRGEVSGIAISMPGMLDNTNGYCKTAGSLSYLAGSTVGDELEDRYSLPISVENDGKCAALAELWQGSLKGCTNAAILAFGTAVAGGIIIDGKLLRGADFTAGEYSFLCTDWHDAKTSKLSYWGPGGGVRGLQRFVAEETGEDWEALNGRIIFERANAGDAATLAGLERWCEMAAVQIYNIHILLDLDLIAIGGGISRQPLLLEKLEAAIDALDREHPQRATNPVLPKPRLTTCTFFNEANLIGALYHFLNTKVEPERSE